MWSYLKSWVVDTNETDDNLEDESLLAELDLLPEDELEEAVKHGVVTGKLFSYITYLLRVCQIKTVFL